MILLLFVLLFGLMGVGFTIWTVNGIERHGVPAAARRRVDADRRIADGERRRHRDADRDPVLPAGGRDHEPGRDHASARRLRGPVRRSLPRWARVRVDRGEHHHGRRVGVSGRRRHVDFRRPAPDHAPARVPRSLRRRHQRELRGHRSDHPAEHSDGVHRRDQRALDRAAVPRRRDPGLDHGQFPLGAGDGRRPPPWLRHRPRARSRGRASGRCSASRSSPSSRRRSSSPASSSASSRSSRSRRCRSSTSSSLAWWCTAASRSPSSSTCFAGRRSLRRP